VTNRVREGVSVLGSTGSIGCSTLDVIARHPDRFRVVALSAHRNMERLAQQCGRHDAAFAVIDDPALSGELRKALDRVGSNARILAGDDALTAAVELEQTQTVMAAIVGAAGLRPALRTAELGKRLLLANKESMVIAGALFARAARASGATIIPVDSEHNALFQALPEDYKHDLGAAGVEQLILTASGGPFRTTPAEELATVTPEQACAHPNWDMGRKISVDSATLMNKGLEVIEAAWLFHARPDQIKVVVHPQSIVHSLVAYRDGSLLAQLGMPDMRTPIAHALAWPERIESGVERLDLSRMSQLEFYEPDLQRFPCLGLAFAALQAGGSAPVALNAANEVAVEAFLDRKIGFMDIPKVITDTLQRADTGPIADLEAVIERDMAARRLAREAIQKA
jgi:1-deoxy-D-xylulose-5-phosphate reductoisomerase